MSPRLHQRAGYSIVTERMPWFESGWYVLGWKAHIDGEHDVVTYSLYEEEAIGTLIEKLKRIEAEQQ